LVHIGIQKKSIGSLVGGFKSTVTKQINQIDGTYSRPIWQRNYYEHIIRNETMLSKIREYIINNPLNWDKDKINPINF
jgi:putative transposase